MKIATKDNIYPLWTIKKRRKCKGVANEAFVPYPLLLANKLCLFMEQRGEQGLNLNKKEPPRPQQLFKNQKKTQK
jgi:hypothetical protein